MTAIACSVEGLAKTFKVGFWGRKVRALESVDLSIAEGQIFGLVGPNGAGKSTTMKIILGLVRADRGGGQLLGHPLGSRLARARLGYQPELPSFPKYLTAREIMDFHHTLSGRTLEGWTARRDAILEKVGLARASGLRLGTYSKGMLQRCALAVALCADPDLLVLDEPMSGLDPLGRHDVRTIIREQRALGKTVLFSSHVLSDVEALCDSVAILSQGRVFRAGPLAEVTRGTTQVVEIQVAGLPPVAAEQLRPLGQVRTQGEVLLWEVPSGKQQEGIQLVLRLGGTLQSVAPLASPLEALLVAAEAAHRAEGRVSP